MKVVILAGGLGTRISEESHLKPKPMIEIGGKPILWHIMKFYSSYGFNDFIVCCGYKSFVIKEFFYNYYLHTSDVSFDFQNGGQMEVHRNAAEPWKVTLVDTGLNTATAGRVLLIKDHLDTGEPFFLTYGDGLSDVCLPDLVNFHNNSGGMATVTAIQPAGRFGVLDLGTGDKVDSFVEKPPGDNAWINGGFMILHPDVVNKIPSEDTSLEGVVLPQIAEDGKLSAYRHKGFWLPMDTVRDRNRLEKLWESQEAPWKRWDN